MLHTEVVAMAVIGARAGCDSPDRTRRKPRVRARREAAVVFDVASELRCDEGAVECDAVPVGIASEMWALMDLED